MPGTDELMNTIFYAVLAVAGIVVFGAALMYLLQEKMIYHPTSDLITTPETVGLVYELVAINTEDHERITGWFIPHPDERAVFLFLHGNAGNISGRVQSAKLLHDLGLSILIIDYRGYGKSTGTLSEEGTYVDAMAAWNYLTEMRGVPAEKIVIYGRSLGGAVAIWLATRCDPKALIVASSFTSISDMARDMFLGLPLNFLLRYHYNSLERISRIKCPVLVIHSIEDDLIPFKHGKKLYEAAPPPKQFLTLHGGHAESIFVSTEEYLKNVDGFVSNYVNGERDM